MKLTSHMDGYRYNTNQQQLPLVRDPDGSKTEKPDGLVPVDSLKRLYELSKPEHKQLMYSAALMGVATGVQLCIPASTGMIIDSALAPSSESSVSTMTLLMGLFGVMVFAAWLTFIRTMWQAQAGHSFTCRIRQRTYARILCQDKEFFDSMKQGDILSRLAADADLIQGAVTTQALSLLRNIMMSLGAVIMLLYTSFSLAIVSIAVLPPTMFFARRIGRSMKEEAGKVRVLFGQATSLAEQALTCLSTVQQFCAEVYESDQYNKAVQEAHDRAVSTATLQARSSALIQLMANASMLCVLGYGGSLVAAGKMTPGSLAGFVMYSLIMGGNVSGISNTYVDIMKAVAALDRMLEIVDHEPSIPPPPALEEGGMLQVTTPVEVPEADNQTPAPMEHVRPMSIDFQHVSFAYPARPDVPVLQDFSLQVEPGQVVALVGASGAGKSTVAALVTRLYDPTEGRLLVDNRDDWSPQDLRASAGIVAQEPLLFPTSISDNIRYGKRTAAQSEIQEAARLAHVWEFSNSERMPQGLDTVVGPRGTQLSGGQKQRVAVARCLVKNPSILVLDEATSALDAESEHHVQKALEKACEGRTVLLIAHRLSSIRQADKVVVLQNGRVVEQGKFDELVANSKGVFRQLVERQLVE